MLLNKEFKKQIEVFHIHLFYCILYFQVCLRNSPMFHAGALAFTTVDGTPKVGQLLESAWSLNDTCRFKIKPSYVYVLSIMQSNPNESTLSNQPYLIEKMSENTNLKTTSLGI